MLSQLSCAIIYTSLQVVSTILVLVRTNEILATSSQHPSSSSLGQGTSTHEAATPFSREMLNFPPSTHVVSEVLELVLHLFNGYLERQACDLHSATPPHHQSVLSPDPSASSFAMENLRYLHAISVPWKTDHLVLTAREPPLAFPADHFGHCPQAELLKTIMSACSCRLVSSRVRFPP